MIELIKCVEDNLNFLTILMNLIFPKKEKIFEYIKVYLIIFFIFAYK
jgi:hypothetical protein